MRTDFEDARAERGSLAARIKFYNVRVEVRMWLFGDFLKLIMGNTPKALDSSQSFSLLFLEDNAGTTSVNAGKIVRVFWIWELIENFFEFLAVNP